MPASSKKLIPKIALKSKEDVFLLGIKIGIALILLTPLVISRYTPFPVVYPKTIYFQTLVEIVFLLYILLLIWEGKKYLPRFSPVLIALFVFTEVLMFAALRGVNFERSLWGTVERGEGLFLHIHLFALFLVLSGTFKKRQDWLNILRFTLFVSVPVGLAAFAQKFGWLAVYTDLSSGRVAGTFGNPVFFGSYLVLIMMLAITMGIFEKDKKWRAVSWSLVFFNSILLILSGTRGAWLGIMAGLVCFAVSWFFFIGRKTKERRQVFLFGIFVLLLFSLLFIFLSEEGYIPRTYVLDRYESSWLYIVNGKDARSFVWQLGLEAWLDSPIFGHGPESFNYVYDKYYDSKFLEMFPGQDVSIIPENIFFDRSHNRVIDILVTSGIAGLLSYLAIFALALAALFRGKFKPPNALLPFSILALFVGYFVQNIFTFDTSSTYLIIIVLLAFIDVSSRDERKFAPAKLTPESDPGVNLKIAGSVGAAAVILFVIFTVNIQPALAFSKVISVHGFVAQSRTRDALDAFNAALQGPEHTRFEVSYYGLQAIFNGMQIAEVQGLQDEAAELLKVRSDFMAEHLRNNKEVLHMRALMLVAGTYKSLYIAEKNPAYLEAEEKVLGDAIRMNPRFPKLYQLTAEMRILQDRLEEAQIFLMKGYELDHNWGKFYEWLGASFIEAGKKDLGAQYLRKSLLVSDFYNSPRFFKIETVWNLAAVYEEAGDWKTLADFYEEVIMRHSARMGPPNAQLFASLSTVYARMGELEKARDASERMLKLYPSLTPQAAAFLKELEDQKNASNTSLK